MACIIKLKENQYIEYDKTSDTLCSNIMTKDEASNLIKKSFTAQKHMNPKVDIEKDTKNLLIWLESRGTTDLGGGVDLKFVLKYNSSGKDGAPLSLDEILAKYK